MNLKSSMRKLMTMVLVIFLSSTCFAQSKVNGPPYGFRTLDFSIKLWASEDDSNKFKGKVGQVLDYQNIDKIIVLRERISMTGVGAIDRFVQLSIPSESQFWLGPVPEQVSRNLEYAFLTLLFETKKGDRGLLTIYSGMAILELNNKVGMILRKL